MNSLIEHFREVYWLNLVVEWPSILTAFGLAVGCGIVGVFVLLRREGMVALAMPQIVTLGAVVGIRFAVPRLAPALAAVAAALLALAWSKRRGTEGLLLPALYVAGVCLSILLVANAGAHLIEVQHLFTGIDVAVDEYQAAIVTTTAVIVGVAVALLWRRWLLIAQAPAAAELACLHPVRWNGLFLGLLGLLLVLGAYAVGPVMVVALLFLPAATVLPWTGRIPTAMIASVAVAVASVAAGFELSVEMEWPLSHSVGGAGLAMFVISHVLAQIMS